MNRVLLSRLPALLTRNSLRSNLSTPTTKLTPSKAALSTSFPSNRFQCVSTSLFKSKIRQFSSVVQYKDLLQSRKYPKYTHFFTATSTFASAVILTNTQITPTQQQCSVNIDDIETVLEFEEKISSQHTPEQLFPGLPVYTLDDVKSISRITNQNDVTKRIIIIHGDYIYDLTEFAEVHPGGDKILQAMYTFADPFWLLYTIHKESPIVFQVLNEFRVGILSPHDRKLHHDKMKELELQQSEGKNSQWKYEAIRHPLLRYLSITPCNAEAPLYLCPNEFITPNDLFFIRNHHPAPVCPTLPSASTINESPQNFTQNDHGILVDAATSTWFLPPQEIEKYPITFTINKQLYDHGDQHGKTTLKIPYVDGSGKSVTVNLQENVETQQYETVLTIGDLRHILPDEHVVSTVICSGNRRQEMNQSSKGKADGLSWGFGALSNGDFNGIKLSSLFSLFGINYLNYERLAKESTSLDQNKSTLQTTAEPHCIVFALDAPFDTSFPLNHVLNPEKDVMLAFGMNGDALSGDQGYPAKFIVPGASGNRQVKWIKQISIDFHEATSAWHVSTPYRYTGPGTNSTRTPAQSPPVYFWPVFSNILSPISYEETQSSQQPHKLLPSTVQPHRCSEGSLLSLKAQLLRNFPSMYPNPNSINVETDLLPHYQCVDVSGLAYVGNGIGINRVDTTVLTQTSSESDPKNFSDISDDQLIWTEALLQREMEPNPISSSTNATKHNHWAWVLWKSEVVLPKHVKDGDSIEITSKAVDNMFNSQPRSMMNIWNGRGILNNGWCKHPIIIGKSIDNNNPAQESPQH